VDWCGFCTCILLAQAATTEVALFGTFVHFTQNCCIISLLYTSRRSQHTSWNIYISITCTARLCPQLKLGLHHPSTRQNFDLLIVFFFPGILYQIPYFLTSSGFNTKRGIILLYEPPLQIPRILHLFKLSNLGNLLETYHLYN
jgi:hypothetical protein